MNDQRFDVGLLDITDAARFLGIPRGTFHRWARGYPHGGPLLHVLETAPRRAQVPFIAVAEAYVLEALRQAGVRLAKIRPAINRLQAQFGREYALVAPNLATDGISVLWDFSRTREGEGLIEGRTGQLVMREIVEDYLRYIIWADDGYPRALELRYCQPSKVVLDPYRAFGQPIFERSRARVGCCEHAQSRRGPAGGSRLTRSQHRRRPDRRPGPPGPRRLSFTATRTLLPGRSGGGLRSSDTFHTPGELFGTGERARGAADEEWLARVGSRGWAVIGRDVKIYERPSELAAYRRAQVQVFLLPGQALAAELVGLVEVNLRGICTITTLRQVGTWRLTVTGPEPYDVAAAGWITRRRRQ